MTNEEIDTILQACFNEALITPRETQYAECKEIITALINGATDVVVQAPTGKGKSIYAIITALFYKNLQKSSFICTPQLILQDQYYNDYNHIDCFAMLKGRINYCAMKAYCTAQDDVECAKTRNEHRDNMMCEYQKAKEQAALAKITLVNDKILIYLSDPYQNHFAQRDLLIVDEAHRTEDIVVDFSSVNLSRDLLKGLKILLPTKNNNLTQSWFKIVADELTVVYNHSNKRSDEAEVLLKNIKNIQILLEDWDNYVFDDITPKTNIIARPINISEYSYIIHNKGRQRLWLSATIGSQQFFEDQVGLKNTHYISYPSIFPSEKCPVHFFTTRHTNVSTLKYQKENKALEDQQWLNLTKMINFICNKKTHQRGVIHCTSKTKMNFILDNLAPEVRQRCVTLYPTDIGTDDTTRTDVINAFCANTSANTILIGCSLEEGINMKYDTARFQIITKIPYGCLGDKRIKAISRSNSNWYIECTINKIVQACGRIMRAADDQGDTYIIDPAFTTLCNSITALAGRIKIY